MGAIHGVFPPYHGILELLYDGVALFACRKMQYPSNFS